MKPFKTYGGITLAAFGLLLGTSCTKSLDEQQAKGDRDVEQFNEEGRGRCGRFIGLQMKNNTGFFWYESRFANTQDFSANDFSNKRYVDVTASTNGLNPAITTVSPNYRPAGDHIGVLSNVDAGQEIGRINVGEVMTWKLGTDFPGFGWYGFDLQLNATRDCNGNIDLYFRGNFVETVPFTGVGRNVKNFAVTYRSPAERNFDEMRIYPTTGAVRIHGAGQNVPMGLLPTVKLYIIDLPNAVFLNTNSQTNPFINTILNNVITPASGRQLRSTIAQGQPGSGVFDQGANQWLTFSAGMNQSLYWNTSNRLSVGSAGETLQLRSINPGETFTVVAGTSLPFKSFRTLELREAHNAVSGGAPLDVKLWRGMTQVGGGLTSGVDARYSAFYTTEDFDRVTITGTGDFAALGRPGITIRLTRGCPIVP